MIENLSACKSTEIPELDFARYNIGPSYTPYLNVLAGSNLRYTSTVAGYVTASDSSGSDDVYTSVHGPLFPAAFYVYYLERS